MVEDAKPPSNPSPDMYGGRRLVWEDANSIPGWGSAILRIVNVKLSSRDNATWSESWPALLADTQMRPGRDTPKPATKGREKLHSITS